MLKRGINIYLLLFLFSCSTNDTIEKEIKKTSEDVVGKTVYNTIISVLSDSLKAWKFYGLRDYNENNADSESNVDSLICFNKDGTRLIACLMSRSLILPNPSGSLTFMLGEKINSKWYFFSSRTHVFIPHEMKLVKNGSPFNFRELHQIALKEIYSGYLKSNGEINEAWFTSHFEGPGQGDFNDQSSSLKFLGVTEKFTDKRKFFEAIHLQSVKNNWYGVKKDSLKLLAPDTLKQ